MIPAFKPAQKHAKKGHILRASQRSEAQQKQPSAKRRNESKKAPKKRVFYRHAAHIQHTQKNGVLWLL